MSEEMYKHLNKSDRSEISILKDKGYSLRAISKVLGVSVSTISREVKRNLVLGEYNPKKAQHKSYVRRREAKFQSMKIAGRVDFRIYLEYKLRLGWNPLVIAEIWNTENEEFNISHTSIYKFLYSGMGNKLCKYLCTQRYDKKRRKRKTKREMIRFRNPIENRPESINERLFNGHFEADLIVSRRGDRSCFLTLIDRKSRLLKAKKLPNRKPSTIAKWLKVFSKELDIKSITFDNGIEFKNHYELRRFGVETYFCNPYSSWEKGSIENANRIIRRFYPKKSYLRESKDSDLQRIVDEINNIPRKVTNFKTPNEIYFGNS